MVRIQLKEPLEDARASLVRMGERLSLLLQPDYPQVKAIMRVLEDIQAALSFFDNGVVTEKWIFAQVAGERDRDKFCLVANRE